MSKMKWATGAAALTCAGVVGAIALAGSAGAAADPAARPGAVAKPAAVQKVVKVDVSKMKRAAAAKPAVLTGKREVTIVRVQAFEGGLSLDNGELTEVDDDSGRQLFVPTPLGGNKYLIKAYGRNDGHPANDEPACWQVYNPQNGGSLTVEGAVCDAKNKKQQFTITSQGNKTYAISNSSAFLQYFPNSGLILEELGDAPLLSTFRLVDNGPARVPAGG